MAKQAKPKPKNKKPLKKPKANPAKPQQVKASKMNVYIAMAIILFAAIITVMVLQAGPPAPDQITSFEECVAAGYPIMESYPRQCAVPGVGSFTEKITDYYGSSTFGACNSDTDCMASGCNSEICQSRNEEALSSICVVPEKPTPGQVGYECACVSGQCQWA